MADNLGYTPGTGALVATDEIGGVSYQRVKVTTGADGVANDVSAANPMPVSVQGSVAITGGLTDAQLRASPVPVSGSFTISGGLTDAELRASPVPVSLASAPLPTGAATETTLAQVRDRLPTASISMPTDMISATPVRQAPQKYVDISFSQVG